MKAEVTINGLESQIADMMNTELSARSKWTEGKGWTSSFQSNKAQGKKKKSSQSDMEEKGQVCEGISWNTVYRLVLWTWLIDAFKIMKFIEKKEG